MKYNFDKIIDRKIIISYNIYVKDISQNAATYISP